MDLSLQNREKKNGEHKRGQQAVGLQLHGSGTGILGINSRLRM